MDVRWESNHRFDEIVNQLIEDMPDEVCGLAKSDLKFDINYTIRNPIRVVTDINPFVDVFSGGDIGRVYVSYSNDDTYTFYDRITITHIPTECVIRTNIVSLNIAGGIAWAITKLKNMVDSYNKESKNNTEGDKQYAEKNNDEITR